MHCAKENLNIFNIVLYSMGGRAWDTKKQTGEYFVVNILAERDVVPHLTDYMPLTTVR
jgi:hypothetical protein